MSRKKSGTDGKYPVAIMGWASRMVLSWRLSNTLDSSFCVDALEEAIAKHGCPEINTDRGSQFSAETFTDSLRSRGLSIYETFEPKEARRLAERLDIHYTPKHGSC